MDQQKRPSLLKRREPPQAVLPKVQVAWNDNLEKLIENYFYEALDGGLWWGASELGASNFGVQGTLSALARSGARCACVGARAGAAGYLAIIAHPADAQQWNSRMVSSALGMGKRVDFGWGSLLFMQLGRADFPIQPKIFGCNEHEAKAVALARKERDILGQAIVENCSRGSKRL